MLCYSGLNNSIIIILFILPLSFSCISLCFFLVILWTSFNVCNGRQNTRNPGNYPYSVSTLNTSESIIFSCQYFILDTVLPFPSCFEANLEHQSCHFICGYSNVYLPIITFYTRHNILSSSDM